MANNPELRINYTADTSGIKKGSKDAKNAVRDFEKSTNSALNNIGEAMGIPVDKIKNLGSSIQGMGVQMQNSSNTMVKSIGNIIGKVDALAIGVAGIGIGAIVAGFEQLNALADRFNSTMDGQVMIAGIKSYREAYNAAMDDMSADTGKLWSEIKEGWKSFWSGLGPTMRNFITTTIPDPTTGLADNSQIEQFYQNIATAADVGEEAAGFAERLVELQLKEAKTKREVAKLDAQISEWRKVVFDKSVDIYERQEAYNKVLDLSAQKYEKQKSVATEVAQAMEGIAALTGSSVEELVAVENAWANVDALALGYNNFLREMLEKEREITIALQTQEQIKEKAAASRAKMQETQLTQVDTTGLEKPQATTEITNVPSPVLPASDIQESTAALVDYNKELTNVLNTMVTDTITNFATGFGQLVADLRNGEDAWTNFGNNVLSTFADMAVSVGKIAIEVGVATLGIKAALETLNPYIAIAAGAALVALGTAAKSSLSAVASGNTTATVSANSYTNTPVLSGEQTKELSVQVSGTLQADGSTLLAVIENQNYRSKYTR